MSEFVTTGVARERISAALDAIDDAHAMLRETSSDEVRTAFRLEIADRLELQQRTNRGLMYRTFGQLADPPDESLPTLAQNVAARLRIAPRAVKRRMKVAERIRPRRQVCGPPLEPELPKVAAAVESGTIGEDHLRIITKAMDKLPSCVSVPTAPTWRPAWCAKPPRATPTSSRLPPTVSTNCSTLTAISMKPTEHGAAV